MNVQKIKNKKMQKLLRRFIQLLFFCFLPSAYSTAFQGVKYLVGQIGNGKSIQLNSFVEVLILLCVYTIVFDRFFCGYACAFGATSDFLYAFGQWLLKKMKKKKKHQSDALNILQYVKYIILATIIGLCFFGVYQTISCYSPWEAFSLLRSMHFEFKKTWIGWIFLFVIMMGMLVRERFFCHFLCPMGAFFSMLPILPWFRVKREKENCLKGCRACRMNCPGQADIPDAESYLSEGECFMCLKCVENCPKENISTGKNKGELKGNEVWFILFRAGILFGMLRFFV